MIWFNTKFRISHSSLHWLFGVAIRPKAKENFHMAVIFFLNIYIQHKYYRNKSL